MQGYAREKERKGTARVYKVLKGKDREEQDMKGKDKEKEMIGNRKGKEGGKAGGAWWGETQTMGIGEGPRGLGG